MAGPVYQEDRMESRGGGKTAPHGEADAKPVEDHCPYRRTDCGAMSAAL